MNQRTINNFYFCLNSYENDVKPEQCDLETISERNATITGCH